ncbi:MAG: family 31 glucosidase [Erysipelotrichaceae bacterium]|jgi:alpha-D-xyloside xylohydrolase|nr:family 31 glucosidase [Erysipelotrichaceae bacterium]MCI1326085.1 family 31 glucosidase [Solobacterium sp.]MCH4044237.1 family 31 glucosidase [Erysipelotrichaceae bacterium]MCH4121451.1 family 31 glucosidase [Erysipelotrichaceae bacterium]MCI1363487.1 family 31 glucosidase [Solobacterium sp.]
MQFLKKNNALIAKHNGETLCIEAWGENSLRVRAVMDPEIDDENWALCEPIKIFRADVEITEEKHWVGNGSWDTVPIASITNGRLKAVVNFAGVITFYRDDKMILREYFRNYDGTLSKESRCLKFISREWKGVIGGSEYQLTVRFESNDGEKIFGMGQYQQKYMDLKGCTLELAQRNSQVSVPFLVSSLGYGMLWNNPAVGDVTFGKNETVWTARSTKQMDYWITAGDTPKQILQQYTAVTGRAPQFPEDEMGLWQCKLRYRTQQEVLDVARRYVREHIKIDLIVIDFFHWTMQGDWQFDPKYWPDPKAMVDELHSYGIKVVVSVWPSVERRSIHFQDMLEKGLLIRTERGALQTYDYQGDCVEIDAFNPRTREYVWNVCKQNYYDLGIDAFWLDNSEPDYSVYDFDHYRYCKGPALSCSNLYPQMYSRTFDDNMKKLSRKPFANLLRSGWAGSQRYSNVLWSGDVPSTFESLYDQVQAGLNMGLAGIPWWNTDIGGFMSDDVNDPNFRQLLVRWYEFAVYTPVFRLHGDRGPYNIPKLDDRDFGGGYLHTGQPNEMWSYGEDVFRIMKKYYDIRVGMHQYLSSLFKEASENGSPLMRTMFYEFPDDPQCWNLQDQYMFGDKLLAAPILHLNQYSRSVYLPQNAKWKEQRTGTIFDGGQYAVVDAPIDYLPVFEKL